MGSTTRCVAGPVGGQMPEPKGNTPHPVSPAPLARCRVVLVRPTIAANLGATARVMRNMGLSDLVLVAPEADPADRQARQMSTHGEHLLDGWRVVQEFGAAVADCLLVVGTSARTGGAYPRPSGGLPEGNLPRPAGRAVPAAVGGLAGGNSAPPGRPAPGRAGGVGVRAGRQRPE